MRALARSAHIARTLVLWALAGLLGGILLSVTAPSLLGYRSLTVMSGSMEPAIHVGDVVVVRQVSPLDIRIGDIVSFRDPAEPTRLITHRVRNIQVAGPDVEFVTKGDANTAVENWKISQDGTVGRVSYRIWRLGYLLFYVRGPLGRLVLVVVPALVLGAYELWRIWHPRERRRDEAPA